MIQFHSQLHSLQLCGWQSQQGSVGGVLCIGGGEWLHQGGIAPVGTTEECTGILEREYSLDSYYA